MTDEELFFNQFDSNKPLESARKCVEAAAARFYESWLVAYDHMEDALLRRVLEIFDPDTLWIMAIVIVAWVIISIIGGPIAGAVNVAVIVIGLVELFDKLKQLGTDFVTFVEGAYYADDREDLEAAGMALADFLALGGITIFETIVLNKAFRLARTQLARRFPLSKYLRDRHAARKVERKKRGKLERIGDKVNEKALDIALKNPALVVEAAKRTTKEIDDSLPLGVGLAALGVAVVGTIVVLKAIEDGKRRR